MKMDYIMDRLKEPSTWRGMILIATSIASLFGKKYNLSAEQITTIITIGISIAGIAGALMPDKLKASGKTAAEAIADAVGEVSDKESDVKSKSGAIAGSGSNYGVLFTKGIASSNTAVPVAKEEEAE